MSTDQYQGVDRMIDKLNNDRNPYEMTEQQERLQAEQDDDRESEIESRLEELQKDADAITDAIIDDGYELAYEIAGIVAKFNEESENASHNQKLINRSRGMAEIVTKVNAALKRVAEEEHEED